MYLSQKLESFFLDEEKNPNSEMSNNIAVAQKKTALITTLVMPHRASTDRVISINMFNVIQRLF